MENHPGTGTVAAAVCVLLGLCEEMCSHLNTECAPNCVSSDLCFRFIKEVAKVKTLISEGISLQHVMLQQECGSVNSNSVHGCYSVVRAFDGFICGIGFSVEEAENNARLHTEVLMEGDDDVLYETQPCTKALYNLVAEQGGDVACDVRFGVWMTPREANELSGAWARAARVSYPGR